METAGISALGQVTLGSRATLRTTLCCAVQTCLQQHQLHAKEWQSTWKQELKQNGKLVNAPWLVYTHLSYYAVKPQLQVIRKELVKKQEK